MIDVTLHRTPRWRDVVLEQIRIVGLSLRREAIVVAVVLAIGTAIVGADIGIGGPGFDSDETFPTAVISFLFPFAVWRGERRFGASFLWTLPVERQRLALAKVLAGFVWLMAALAVFFVWLLVLGWIGGVPLELTVLRVPLSATIATYLFGSALLLGLRHPLRWMFGAAGVAFLVGGASDALESFYGVQTLMGSSELYRAVTSTHDVWRSLPALTQRLLAAFLSLGPGLLVLWAAASRHKETR